MIPISSLITPYHPIEQADPMAAGAALGSVGTFLEDRRKNQVAEDLDKLKADRDYELGKSKTEGTNEYYASQAETAREKIKSDREAKGEASTAKLLDQLPAAHLKGPSYAQAIYDWLKAMGHTVTESDTALPEDKPAKDAVQAVNQQTAKPPKAAPKKQSILPPEFAGYDALAAGSKSGSSLAQSSYASTDENGEQAPPPPAGTAAKRPVPPEIAALVPEGASPPSPSVGPAPMKRGGKFTVTDSNGNVIHEYDAPLEQKRARDQVMAMGQAIGIHARSPEEEQAVQAAAEGTAAMADKLSAKEQMDFFKSIYQAKLGEFKKTRMAGDVGGGVGAGGPSKTDLKIEGMGNEETNRIIARVRQTTHAEKAAEAEAAAQAGLASLDAASQGGMQQLEALKQHMLALSGKVVTDREMGQFMGSTGAWNEIQAKMAKWTSGGELPEGFLSQLRGVLMTGLQTARTRRNAAAQNAYQQTLLSTGDKRQAVIARGNFNDDFSMDEDTPAAPKSAGVRPSAPKAAAPPAPASGDTDARMKAWLAKQGVH